MSRRQAAPSSRDVASVPGVRAGAARDLLIYLSLLAATALVFVQVRHFPLVDFDDLLYVTHNPNVTAGLTLESVTWAFTKAYEGYWSPLTWLSYMADVQFFGPASGPHHVTNVLIHAASACLLFALLKRATKVRSLSAGVAMLFAIHPLHVESVAWVAERKDVLSGFFWFLTCWAYLRYVERPAAATYAVVVASFACGLMSKPMIVTLPLVLLLLDAWPLNRLSMVGHAESRGKTVPRPGVRQVSLVKALLEKAPLAAMAIAVSAVTVVTQRNAGGISSLDVISPLTRVENALVSSIIYLVQMVWPSGLAALYPHPLQIPFWQAAAAALVLAGISILAVRAARTAPYLLVGWLWYLIALLPVLGLVQAGVQARADRYTYVPMVGIGIMVAWGLAALARRAQATRRALAVAACIALSIYGVLAWQQVQYWRNSETLFRRAIAVTTGNYVAHAALGKALRQDGRIDAAIAELRESIRITPMYADAHDALGEALLAEQRANEALPYLAEAVRLSPASAAFLVNFGAALNAVDRVDEAAVSYREAIRLSPDNAEAHSGLGGVLVEQGRFEEAQAEFNDAIRLDPGYAPAHHNLGALLSRTGSGDKAVPQFAEVVRLEPDSAEAHLDLGTILAAQGRMEEAIAELTIAARLKPDDAAVRNNLGGALLVAGQFDAAIVQFTEAIRLRPDMPELKNNLDLAMARQRNVVRK